LLSVDKEKEKMTDNEVSQATFRKVPLGQTASEVCEKLVAQFSSGVIRNGDRLGSERDMARELGISRTTLRQALDVLEDDGYIRRVPGRGGGTFVVRGKIERDPSRIVGVPALLRSQGVTAGTRVLSSGLVDADPVTSRHLDLKVGELVVSLVRIRLADGSPISIEHAMLPADRFPGLLELPLGGSVYELLSEHYHTHPSDAVEQIEVVTASREQADLLDMHDGQPLLSITRTTKDQNGELIEFSHDLFRADRIRLVVRTPGQGGITHSVRTRGTVVELQAQAVS